MVEINRKEGKGRGRWQKRNEKGEKKRGRKINKKRGKKT